MIGTVWNSLQSWPLWLILLGTALVLGLVIRTLLGARTSEGRRTGNPPPRIVTYDPRNPDDCNAYQQRFAKRLRKLTRVKG
jgi:hypothetical protein